jgi:hypothetical protein
MIACHGRGRLLFRRQHTFSKLKLSVGSTEPLVEPKAPSSTQVPELAETFAK